MEPRKWFHGLVIAHVTCQVPVITKDNVRMKCAIIWLSAVATQKLLSAMSTRLVGLDEATQDLRSLM